MSTYRSGRKRHNHVDQGEMLEALREVGGSAILADIAEHFDVSEGSARRSLDGLVAQGQLSVTPGRHREYAVVE